ncbi:MAG TPA: hypothetical protein VLX33_00125 [Nitrososphaerales archaeon]|nr:hypothetical protein [Nitrososphaerales archaeon]
MPVKRVTILRWTGRGSLSHLKGSVERVLKAHGVHGRVSGAGSSVVVHQAEPLGVAALVRFMPGVSWVAAGFIARSYEGLAEAGASLARSYLRRGERFSVEAEGTSGTLASDIGGGVTGKMLETVKGARVSESPRVRFRVAADGRGGVVGVEVCAGVGGTPTGTEEATCYVSGGVHSSVCAWMAAVSGYRVRMVHAKASDESVLAVARLYSEISNRVDPRGVSLEVLKGGRVAAMLSKHAAETAGELFGGFTPGRSLPEGLRGVVSAPVYLLPEERFAAIFESLGIRAAVAVTDWRQPGSPGYSVRTFRGGPADVSGVLDGLR